MTHRDYRSTANVHIYVFKDRIEVVSPGGLPAGMTEADLGVKSMPRNPLLFGMLYRMGVVENIGSGIKRIHELCREHGVAKPTIDASEHWVTVTFPRPTGQVETEQIASAGTDRNRISNAIDGELEAEARSEGESGPMGSRPASRSRPKSEARVRARVRARVAGVARPGTAGRETALEVWDGRRFGTPVRVRGSQESHPRSAERRAHRLHNSGQAEQPTSEIPNHTGRAIGTRGFGQVNPFRSAESSFLRRIANRSLGEFDKAVVARRATT